MADVESGERTKDHLAQYREDPDKGHDWNPYGKVVPALLLVATGRTTGKLRTRPLIYGRDGDSYVIVASKGGAPEPPGWYKNITANPDCEIQVRHDVIPVRARTAEGAERDRLWTMMAAILPQYDEYQSRTDRPIQVVVLDPR
ncbi:MAG: nitroreductase family deazaflavin-dependent oxidoreductase [Ilumatobacteraceae bacterium]